MILKKKTLVVANVVTPIVCFAVLSLLSLGKGDYNQIFQPVGYESLIDPASFTFAIWGPIFFLLFGFLEYQIYCLRKKDGELDTEFIDQISVYFVASTILTSFWYISWLYRVIWLATVFMVLYLVCLVIGYLRLNINFVERSRIEKIAVGFSWSMYTAWVTAATIVSVTTFLVSLGFADSPLFFSEVYWAVIVLLVALVVYCLVVVTRNDVLFGAVGIWVLIGILYERITASFVVMELVVTPILGIVVLSLVIVYQIIKSRKASKG